MRGGKWCSLGPKSSWIQISYSINKLLVCINVNVHYYDKQASLDKMMLSQVQKCNIPHHLGEDLMYLICVMLDSHYCDTFWVCSPVNNKIVKCVGTWLA